MKKSNSKIPRPITKASAVRLTLKSFAQLRDLMQHHKGRAWLEKLVAREHKKVFGASE